MEQDKYTNCWTIHVTRSIKGTPPANTQVCAGDNSEDVFSLDVGKTYLFYSTTPTPPYRIGLCSNTARIEDSVEKLKALGIPQSEFVSLGVPDAAKLKKPLLDLLMSYVTAISACSDQACYGAVLDRYACRGVIDSHQKGEAYNSSSTERGFHQLQSLLRPISSRPMHPVGFKLDSGGALFLFEFDQLQPDPSSYTHGYIGWEVLITKENDQWKMANIIWLTSEDFKRSRQDYKI